LLYEALSRLGRVFQFRDREKDCCRGLSAAQVYALEILVWDGPLSLNQLAAYLFLDKSTVSRLVESLTRAGLIDRKPDTDDRRAVVLKPTQKGRRLCRQIQDDQVPRTKATIADLKPKERRLVIEVLERLTRELEERAGLDSGCSACE